MAFRDTARDPGFLRNLPKHRDNVFYNTDGFVGPPGAPGPHRGSQNLPDDVMLVQHFLKIIAQNPGKFTNPFRPPKKFPVMKVDGVFGDITDHWIQAFQQHTANIGRPVLRDAVVDKVLNGGSLAPHGHVFTHVLINVGMGQVTGDDFWDEWWKEPDVPGLLRSKIRNPATFL
jgi:hypothetical protein